MSWRVDITCDSSGRWYETMERFVSREDAVAATRWWEQLVRIKEVRIVETRDSAKHRMRPGFDVFGRTFQPERVAA